MKKREADQSTKQVIFREMVLGTLVYAVVLGFFEDYTAILSTWSYSVTFMVAVVMQVLTYLTFWLKNKVILWHKQRKDEGRVVVIVLGVWLIMFVSKFVFLAVIDIIFGSQVDVSGFVGLMLVIVTMSLVKKGIDMMYIKLGE